MTVINLAQKLQVHPAIVAGRVRYERRNYRLLSQFVGSGEVRHQFESAEDLIVMSAGCLSRGRRPTLVFKWIDRRFVSLDLCESQES